MMVGARRGTGIRRGRCETLGRLHVSRGYHNRMASIATEFVIGAHPSASCVGGQAHSRLTCSFSNQRFQATPFCDFVLPALLGSLHNVVGSDHSSVNQEESARLFVAQLLEPIAGFVANDVHFIR